jgi:chemotaxis protein MotB
MAAPAQPIIIIKRKKVAHGGRHGGGAWKVAYADFVTAMMALFVVLWLLSSSDQVKKAVGGYFTDPNGHGKEVGNGLKGSGSESLSVNKDDMSKLKDKLEQAIKDTSTLQKIKEHVVFTVTNEGLRVELLEDESGTFFESGSPIPTPAGRDLLAKLAEEIGELPNRITMEGHTDSKPFSGKAGYTNWELSSDRANAARRWMQDSGMREDQVAQVRGFADQSLRNPADAADPKNRRITVIILYAHTAETEAEDKAKAEEEKTSKTEAKPAESKGRESRPAAKPGAKPAAKTSAFSFLDPVTKIFGKK